MPPLASVKHFERRETKNNNTSMCLDDRNPAPMRNVRQIWTRHRRQTTITKQTSHLWGNGTGSPSADVGAKAGMLRGQNTTRTNARRRHRGLIEQGDIHLYKEEEMQKLSYQRTEGANKTFRGAETYFRSHEGSPHPSAWISPSLNLVPPVSHSR